MKVVLLLTLISLPNEAFAAENKPFYLGKTPDTYCAQATTLDKSVRSCKDNAIYFRAAKQCMDDFSKLRAKVTRDLTARLTAAATKQNENFQANEKDLAEAALAHAYLIKLGEKALEEMDGYFDFFEHPEDAETDEEILSEPCFIQPADGLDNLIKDFDEEVENMRQAKAIELVNSQVSGSRKSNLNSITEGTVDKGAVGKSAPSSGPKGKDQRKSDISGTEEKKKGNP